MAVFVVVFVLLAAALLVGCENPDVIRARADAHQAVTEGARKACVEMSEPDRTRCLDRVHRVSLCDRVTGNVSRNDCIRTAMRKGA